MKDNKIISERESLSIDYMKTISIFFVIAAHVILPSQTNLISKVITSLWDIFSNTGVVIFFVIGGFFYSRNEGDTKTFWSKKFFRIILPWLFCSVSLYFVLNVFITKSISVVNCFKYVLGSGSLYYYATVYTFFLLIFKYFYKKEYILYGLIAIQIISLTLSTCGFSVTLPFDFFTDYLNPIYWVGYFAFGVISRKHRLDKIAYKNNFVLIISLLTSIVVIYFIFIREYYGYFDILVSIFCILQLIIIARFSYFISKFDSLKKLRIIGTSSYCIYLLHMPIVQGIFFNLPQSLFLNVFSPILGLAIMMILIIFGKYVCKFIPFGKKIEMLIGL